MVNRIRGKLPVCSVSNFTVICPAVNLAVSRDVGVQALRRRGAAFRYGHSIFIIMALFLIMIY